MARPAIVYDIFGEGIDAITRGRCERDGNDDAGCSAGPAPRARQSEGSVSQRAGGSAKVRVSPSEASLPPPVASTASKSPLSTTLKHSETTVDHSIDTRQQQRCSASSAQHSPASAPPPSAPPARHAPSSPTLCPPERRRDSAAPNSCPGGSSGRRAQRDDRPCRRYVQLET